MLLNSNFFSMDNLINMLISLPAILWAISFHEFCHGFVANKLGDPTAERQGRMSLNPLAHIDPVGMLSLLLFRVGWAKPVPIDPRYFQRPKRDILLVSIAGITGNLLTALFFGLLLHFLIPQILSLPGGKYWMEMFLSFVFINVGFAVFNLLPIPPLDGSRLIVPLLPKSWIPTWVKIEQYGIFIMILLVATGVISKIITPIFNLVYHLIISPYI